MYDESDFTKLSFSIPQEMYDFLHKLAGEKRLPIGRLICFAVDNEREAENAFDYDIAEPTQTYIPDAYSEEAQMIFRFMLRYPAGMSLDLVCLFRRMIGIPSREKFLLAMRDAIKGGILVASSTPPRGTFYKQFGPDTIWIRLAPQYIDHIEKQRAFLAKKQEELNKKQEKIKPYLPPEKGGWNAKKED